MLTSKMASKFKREVELINLNFDFNFESPSNVSCFSEDDALPSLPVPELSETLKLYLESVQPHLTEAEFKHTEKLVKEFENGQGKELQKLLHSRASGTRNWLETWWLEYAYLRSRAPAVPISNMAGPDYIHRCVWYPKDKPGVQENHAAQFLHYLLKFWRLIRLEKLIKERRRDGRSLSMYQFKHLFNSYRVPKQTKDELENHFRTIHEGSCPRHIIVIYKGRYFFMDVVDEENRVFSPDALERAFKHITSTYSGHAWGPSVGALTTLPRDEWATLYEDLSHLGDNARLLRLFSEAILIVSLEMDSPNSEDNCLWFTMCADARNRWADKAYNLVAFKNGLVTNSCDHTPMEGSTVSSGSLHTEFSIYRNGGTWSLDKEKDPNSIIDPVASTAGDLYEELSFTLSPHIETKIEQAIISHREICAKIAAKDFVYPKFGRLFLRSFDLHPDTVVQLALQLAFYRLHSYPPSVYETASTRHHWRGRTETIRSLTPASFAWMKSMEALSPQHSETIALFLAAHKHHNDLRNKCEAGRGCDRHLMGLQILAMETGQSMPELFLDPAYTKSGGGANFSLSTSFSGYLVCLGIIPAMIEDGYGAFYRIGPEMIHAFVSAYHSSQITDIHRFCEEITRSLDDICLLLNHYKSVNVASPKL